MGYASITSKSISGDRGIWADAPRGFLLVFALLYLVSQIPLYAVRYPDITDYPNHVARLYVLLHLDGSALLRSFYMETPGLAPNLALDFLGMPLSRLLGPELGVKIFISASTLLLATGTMVLGIALTGRLTFLGLGGLLFAQNAFAHLGLLNFVFGVGFALWLLAAWIFMRARRSIGTATMAAFSAGATLLYLTHLTALGIYAIGVFAFEGSRAEVASAPRRFLNQCWIPTVQCMPATAVHVFAYEPGTNLPFMFPVMSIIALVAYKAALILFMPLIAFDVYVGLTWLIAAPIAVSIYRAIRLGLVSFARPGTFIMAGMGVVLLLLPPRGFGSNMVDMRMMLPLVLVGWASLCPAPRNGVVTGSRLVPWGIALGVLLASAGTMHRWSEAEPSQRDLRQAMLAIDEGGKVAVVDLGSSDGSGITQHAAAWSVVDRSTFLSSLFVRPFQPFTLGYRPEFAALARLARLDNAALPPPLEALRGQFDYAVVFGRDAETETYAGDSETMYRSPSAILIRLRSP